MPARQPEMATVVLCYRSSTDVVGAVRSLLEQETPTEILVVNSGGGNASEVLRQAGLDVPCIEYEERLHVGAARNRGIANTKAAYVAFLASDCRARPGWIEGRLIRHRAGARAVASAIVNSHPLHLVACAAYLCLFMRRLPGLPDDLAIRFGASYDRQIFGEYGLFEENVPTNEDTDFLKRLPPQLYPVWAPDVQTVHINETRFLDLVSDQFRRGVRYGHDMHRVFGKSRLKIARDVLRGTRHARKFARLGLKGPELDRVMMAMPLIRIALLANAGGVLLSRWRTDGQTANEAEQQR